jgi:hypothetical protein
VNLPALLSGLQAATAIACDTSLDAGDLAQIRVAFAVRHLIEHTDARVDRAFCEDIKDARGSSSWAADASAPVPGDRIWVD